MMPPFNYSEEPMQLFISSDDGKTYEPFTGLKDVEIVSDDTLEPSPDWVCCPYDVGFSATMTLTKESRKTVKKWGKEVRRYINCLNRKNRRWKRRKEKLRKLAWKKYKGKPPRDLMLGINKVIDSYYAPLFPDWHSFGRVQNVPVI